MKNLGLIIGGMSVSTGIAAGVLFGLNLLVWGILAAWLGSAMGFIGFALIVLAIHPRAQYHTEAATAPEEDQRVDVRDVDVGLMVAKAA